MQLQAVELGGDGAGGAGQEARAHAPRLFAQTQVEAGRLDLVGVERPARGKAPVGEKFGDPAIGKNSLVAQALCSMLPSGR